jgi:hypothetical protein
MEFDPNETARVLKARETERIVTGPAMGLQYKVRALTTEEVLIIRGGIPDLANLPLTDEEAARMSPGTAGSVKDLRIAEAFVKVGLVAPAIGEGEGEIRMAKIPFLDMHALSTAIGELSGISRAAASTIRPTSDSGGSA